MLSIPPPLRKGRASSGRETPPPQTLVLVSANYDETVLVLSLVFDRAIDASAFVAGQVIVNDGSSHMGRYAGVGPAMLEGSTRINVPLVRLGSLPPAPTTLSATALTGLVAVDDRGTWAGVIDLELPYDG